MSQPLDSSRILLGIRRLKNRVKIREPPCLFHREERRLIKTAAGKVPHPRREMSRRFPVEKDQALDSH